MTFHEKLIWRAFQVYCDPLLSISSWIKTHQICISIVYFDWVLFMAIELHKIIGCRRIGIKPLSKPLSKANKDLVGYWRYQFDSWKINNQIILRWYHESNIIRKEKKSTTFSLQYMYSVNQWIAYSNSILFAHSVFQSYELFTSSVSDLDVSLTDSDREISAYAHDAALLVLNSLWRMKTGTFPGSHSEFASRLVETALRLPVTGATVSPHLVLDKTINRSRWP